MQDLRQKSQVFKVSTDGTSALVLCHVLHNVESDKHLPCQLPCHPQ